jgi:hypothetical protein
LCVAFCYFDRRGGGGGGGGGEENEKTKTMHSRDDDDDLCNLCLYIYTDSKLVLA